MCVRWSDFHFSVELKIDCGEESLEKWLRRRQLRGIFIAIAAHRRVFARTYDKACEATAQAINKCISALKYYNKMHAFL